MLRFDSMVFTYAGNDVFIVHGFGKDCIQNSAISKYCNT